MKNPSFLDHNDKRTTFHKNKNLGNFNSLENKATSSPNSNMILPQIANNNFTTTPPSNTNFSMNNNSSPKNMNINKFTLTDHFKNYHRINNKYINSSQTSDEHILTTENDINDGLSSD